MMFIILGSRSTSISMAKDRRLHLFGNLHIYGYLHSEEGKKLCIHRNYLDQEHVWLF